MLKKGKISQWKTCELVSYFVEIKHFFIKCKGGDFVKLKVVALIFLVVLATFASSLVVSFSNNQTQKGKVGLSAHHSIERIDINDTQTQGDPINTPEMPG